MALARRTLRDARTRTVAFAYIFAIYSWIEAAGFNKAYPTAADRAGFARSFAGNDAIRLFYGYPYGVTSVGGYSAWRVGGTLAVAAAAFGVLAAVRAMRAEEDAGRAEIIMAGSAPRRVVFASSVAAIGVSAAILWIAEFAGFTVAGLPAAGSAYLALATLSIVAVFAGIGSLACQLAPDRRTATAVGGGAVALFWLVRVLADTLSVVSWLRWATPLGWGEALRPFAGARPAVLILFAVSSVSLLAGAARLSATRDVGTGLLAPRHSAPASTRLLGTPTAQGLRTEAATLAVWSVAIAALAFIFGMISTSISTAGLSPSIQKDTARFGTGGIATPTGYLSFVFVMFIYVVSMFACAQVGAAREEEAEQRLETVLALPVSRHRWLGGRLAAAAAAACILSALTGLCTWLGAHAEGLSISLPKLMEAGANCVPAAILFLGIAALVYAVVPRTSSAVSYTLVTVCFLWYLVGSVLRAPSWLIQVTPFRHVGLVPVQAFRVPDALVMAAVGLCSSAAALAAFRRRDLLGA